jgi:hypothetical protein
MPKFPFFPTPVSYEKQRKQKQIHRYTVQTGWYTARTDRCTDPNRLYRRLVLNFWICAVLSGIPLVPLGIPLVPLGIPLPRVGGTPPRIGRANPGRDNSCAAMRELDTVDDRRSDKEMRQVEMATCKSPCIPHRLMHPCTGGSCPDFALLLLQIWFN